MQVKINNFAAIFNDASLSTIDLSERLQILIYQIKLADQLV